MYLSGFHSSTGHNQYRLQRHFLSHPCSAPLVVLDSLPIILKIVVQAKRKMAKAKQLELQRHYLELFLQIAALTEAAVLNSLLRHFALLNSLSPTLLRICMWMCSVASNILTQEDRYSPAKDASMMA